mgnify:CR=1 FL=1
MSRRAITALSILSVTVGTSTSACFTASISCAALIGASVALLFTSSGVLPGTNQQSFRGVDPQCRALGGDPVTGPCGFQFTFFDNLVEAYRISIGRLDWMGAETRDRALAKLELFRPKVGYPDTWRDYSKLETSEGPFIDNVWRANSFEWKRTVNRPGTNVDEESLKAWLSERCAKWWLPDRVVFREALPRTGTSAVWPATKRRAGCRAGR